ncbi:D-Ala-D-Ala carboxypeptidase family metallohydrolase [Streptomyces sp. 2A115]|uniref:D-Ala-D-Ala carboxypeptidase family metallohydrolase n=1 Tax=Streptomyces sp. 2A115 TaxID=3457439 RepID=UPI003FCFDB19
MTGGQGVAGSNPVVPTSFDAGRRPFSRFREGGFSCVWRAGGRSVVAGRVPDRFAVVQKAMRHALGDQPITVTSGFRLYTCNSAVGGASNSRHLYGDAGDLGAGPHSLCTLAKQARNHGFRGILDPATPAPGHDDHTRVYHRTSPYWLAPTGGI